MLNRHLIGAFALAAALGVACDGAWAHDESKFPDWSGQWFRTYGGNPRYDQTKPIRKQEAPLKPEYQALYQSSLNDLDAGGFGLDTHYACMPTGMPRQMSGVSRFEFLFGPNVSHILFEDMTLSPRRVYTDGRDWPELGEPTFVGYSVGKWLDTDGDGRYDTLVVETRAIKGPHSYDNSGIPFHEDEKAVVTERIYGDKTNPNVLYAEITTVDNALTRPWTVKRSYRRLQTKPPLWSEYICTEDNRHVQIGDQNYVISADGHLMPTRKGQLPPDLRHFDQAVR